MEELERGLNKTGLTDDLANSKQLKHLKGGKKFLSVSLRQFRLLINRICLFEVTVSHWSVIQIQEIIWHCWSLWEKYEPLKKEHMDWVSGKPGSCHSFLKIIKMNWLIYWAQECVTLLFHQSSCPSTTVKYLIRLTYLTPVAAC